MSDYERFWNQVSDATQKLNDDGYHADWKDDAIKNHKPSYVKEKMLPTDNSPDKTKSEEFEELLNGAGDLTAGEARFLLMFIDHKKSHFLEGVNKDRIEKENEND